MAAVIAQDELEKRTAIAVSYFTALSGYLRSGGEAALAEAYQIGRAALAEGLGLLELCSVHHEALGSLGGPPPLARANLFLAEALSPFEMTHRGFREANAQLAALNRRLLEQNRELETVARQQREAREAADVANRELEAFSYSVSHDLRAPLRAIDGFGQALIKDNSAQIDERGQHYLRRIRAAAQRMGELIDDLLALSRVTRSELRRQRVDLSEAVRTVVEDLRRREPDRRVEVEIAPGLEAQVDGRLVRVLLENLLGNAWKFTAKRTPARIEVGTVPGDAHRVYFIRDDGAGFDATYAHKLFTPFQRLHSEDEFAGTGIGLATVRRIVERHGGRVWAEGELGRGATIYFTLPSE